MCGATDFLKGKFALAKRNNKSNIEESIAYFNEVTRRDPTYAPSYLGLAIDRGTPVALGRSQK
jgi:hypothetical protein